MTTLSIVVPNFNEEESLPETTKRLLVVVEDLKASGKISSTSSIYYIDDGSTDATWSYIEEQAAKNSSIHGIKLSHNQGHQNALLAGLHHAKGDVLISIDADLQDDTDMIEAMIDSYHNGHDIVYGVRNDRANDTLIKRLTAEKSPAARFLINNVTLAICDSSNTINRYKKNFLRFVYAFLIT